MQPSRGAASQQRVLDIVMGDREPDPRAWQVTFAVAMVLAAGLLVVGGAPVSPGTPMGQGVAAALAVTVLAVAVPWRRLRRPWVLVLPVLDVGALGLAGLDPAGESVAPLLVVPTIWSAIEQGRRGVWVAGAAALVLYGGPGVVALEGEGAALAWAVMIPLACLGLGTAVAWLVEAVRAENAEASHHRRVADAILDTVDVGLVLLDSEGGYTTVNRRHEDFMRLAYPHGHAGRAGQLGQVFAEDGTTELSRDEMPTLRAVGGEEFDDCRIWVGKDPLTSRALSVSARSVRDAGDRFAGAALAYKDVTDFMQALRVKDDFVASVSHELRTPLTSIRGYADLLLDHDLPPLAVRQLEVVIRNAERLQRLVGDLLHSAQTDSGSLEVVRSRCDLAATVRDALGAAGPSAAAVSTELVYSGPDSLEALVDPLRLRQVVDNLVSNALKYSPPGRQVVVRLDLDGDRLELSVADQGHGIDAADRDRLFTRFWRSRHAEEQSIQGVGLGLSITKAIVESHGGRIEVDSEVGRGSTFRVRLPLEADRR